jgi:hypothetical protein
MGKRMKAIGVWMLLGGLVFSGSGCALLGIGAVGGVAAGTVYLHGELYHSYSVPIAKAWKAAEEVVAEQEMKVSRKYIENMEKTRVIIGQTRDRHDFQIRLEAKAEDVTQIRVRIGTFGDEAYSQRIHDAIRRKF